MNKSGFTLVEILAVMVILGLLIVFAVPMVSKSKDDALKALSKEQVKNIEDAGKSLGLDLDDYMTDIYNCNSSKWVKNKCSFTDSKWTSIKVTIDDLKAHGYFQDDGGHCSGTITVKRIVDADNIVSDYKIEYNTDEVKC